jgi:hypothetical protein
VIIGLAGLAVYSLAVALHPTGGNVWQRPAVALVIAASAFALLQPPLFNRMVAWLLQRSHRTVEPPVTLLYADLGRWVVLEAVVVVIGGVSVHLLLCSLVAVPPNLLLPVVGAWAAAVVAGNLFFWIPGTSVVRDGAMMLILSQWLPATTAILFVLLIRLWSIASILVIAGLARLLLARPIRP